MNLCASLDRSSRSRPCDPRAGHRSVLGVVNEFAHTADHARPGRDQLELLELSLWLAQTHCGPLERDLVSPDRALRAALT